VLHSRSSYTVCLYQWRSVKLSFHEKVPHYSTRRCVLPQPRIYHHGDYRYAIIKEGTVERSRTGSTTRIPKERDIFL